MNRFWNAFGATLIGAVLFAGQSRAAPRRHVSVDLMAESQTIKAGDTVTVALRERIEDGWHVYWTNPGDSGEPTAVEWKLPDGVIAGDLQWPLPHTIPIAGLTNYGYDKEVLLLADIKLPDKISGSVVLAGKVTYLVCKDICVPEETEVSLTLPVSDRTTPSQFATAIQKAKLAMPAKWDGSASYAFNSQRKKIVLIATSIGEELLDAKAARFFPLSWGVVSNADPQLSSFQPKKLTLELPRGETKETPDRLEGLLVFTKANGERTGYTIAAQKGPDIAGKSAIAPTTIVGTTGGGIAQAGEGGTLEQVATAILFAFLGGIILNLMPCVFPVLALKALSFSKTPASQGREQGYAYLAGVLASFGVSAALIAVFRQGATALGWGFQFQSPAFVLSLSALFFIMGLSLSGVVSFGSGLMSLGDSLARKPGRSGTFFTGVLAAVAATPCTAPFMGAAIGFGMTQPAPILVAILLALGLGFAAPMFLLSVSPSLKRLLPKPGVWMETLKEIMAFPLYATAAWLVWVVSIQTGSDGVLGAAIVLTGVSFAAWLSGKTAFSSLPVKMFAPFTGVAAILAGVSIGSVDTSGSQAASSNQTAQIREEAFSGPRLAELRALGKPVFVNLTAAWCITCKVNERIALRSASIAQAFETGSITYLKGDWTKQNPEISALLTEFGRAGVPLYLFYPAGGGEPRILPQLLTEGLVLDEIKTRSATAPQNKGA